MAVANARAQAVVHERHRRGLRVAARRPRPVIASVAVSPLTISTCAARRRSARRRRSAPVSSGNADGSPLGDQRADGLASRVAVAEGQIAARRRRAGAARAPAAASAISASSDAIREQRARRPHPVPIADELPRRLTCTLQKNRRSRSGRGIPCEPLRRRSRAGGLHHLVASLLFRLVLLLSLPAMNGLHGWARTRPLVFHTTLNWPLAWISPMSTGFHRWWFFSSILIVEAIGTR